MNENIPELPDKVASSGFVSKYPKATFLSDLAEKGAKFFLQFGGQGNSFLGECSRLYRDYPELERFFETVFHAIDDEFVKDRFSNSNYLQFGFDLKKWLVGEDIPPDAYLNSCSISLASIHITQMAYYHLLELHGALDDTVLKRTIGITGHSQGIHSACLVAMRSQGDLFYETLSKFVKYYLYSGLVCQTSYPIRVVSDELLSISEKLDRSPPGPMAVVGGLDPLGLQKLLGEYNSSIDEKDHITVSLENTRQILVVSANPEDLLKFRIRNFDLFKTNNINWYYLEITAPFHSHFMPGGLDLFKADIETIGFYFKGSDLKIPVYDTFTGRNMQEVDSLAEYLFELQVTHPLIWQNSISALVDDMTVTHVIDLGPGRSSSFFTKEILGERPIEIFTVAGRVGLKQLLR